MTTELKTWKSHVKFYGGVTDDAHAEHIARMCIENGRGVFHNVADFYQTKCLCVKCAPNAVLKGGR